MASTLKDVADLAGVSPKTVSRVINGQESVRSTTAARVRDAIAQIGYVPNVSARNLARRKSRTVGVVLPSSQGGAFVHHFLTEIVHGIDRIVNECGYDLLLLSQRQDMGFAEWVVDGRVDGVIILNSPSDDPRSRHLRDSGVPAVFACRPAAPESDLSDSTSWVDSDHKLGGLLAVRHLVGLGHRNLILLSGPLSYAGMTLRKKGFLAGLDEVALSVEDSVVEVDEFSIDAGRSFGAMILQGRTDTTAIVCGDDDLAIGAMLAARDLGRRVPKDLSIVGHDDIAYSTAVYPPLTTVRQNARARGETAAKLVIDAIDNDTFVPKQVELPVYLVQRGSTASPSDDRTQQIAST